MIGRVAAQKQMQFDTSTLNATLATLGVAKRQLDAEIRESIERKHEKLLIDENAP